MQPERHTDDSDLTVIARAIRRRIWVVVICLAAASLAAVLLTLLTEKKYEATGALLVSASAAVDPDRAMDTSLQLLSLPVIADSAAQRLPGVSDDEVSDAIETAQEGDSDIIEVSAIASSPALAARIGNVFMDEFLDFRVGGDTERFEEGRIELLELASSSQDPVSPNPVRNIVFGTLIGLFLGLGLALLLERLDRRVKRQDDLAEATGLTLLASVPRREAFDREHLGKRSLSPAEMEAFRLLRANLRYFKVRKDISSVVVTSAVPGEGKTVISLGLALAAASSGERALLLEADMRDPGLSEILGITSEEGLSRALSAGQAGAFADAVTQVRAEDLATGVGDATLDLLLAGAVPPNPTELVESQRMKDLLAFAEQEYDFVVIDTPPVLVVSDAIPLISGVSGVLAVSGLDVSTRATAAELGELLERLRAPTLGLVANFAEDAGKYEGYGYGRPPEITLAQSGEKPAQRQ